MKRLILAILIVGIVLLMAIPIVGCTQSEPKPFPPPEGYTSWDEEQTNQSSTQENTSSSPEAFKASCITVEYNSLERNTESYEGKAVYFQGEVLQVKEVGGDEYVLRVSVTQDEHGWWDYDDVIWVNYQGPRVIEDDIVNIWGIVQGRTSYIAVLGNEVVLPEINAVYLEITTIEPVIVDLSASFRITDWEQEYYDYSEEWSDYVEIYYEIENTGDAEIDYYKVYFTVICKGGNEYYDWANGSSVSVGKKLSGHTMIDVGGREVREVEITDWELENY